MVQNVRLTMSALTRNKAGGYTARKSIPKDVRADYQRLFGPGWEAKLTLPADLPLPEAKAKFSEWLAEIETRIATIRARQRGEAQGLTRTQARALAGEWYQWFLARNEERPGGPEHWALVFDVLVDELRDLDPEGMWAQGQNVDLERVLRDNLTGIRPFFSDHAHTGQFLASRGVVLTNDARDLFLDHVASDYLAAIGLLQQRAEGDYSPDDRPRHFPQFTRPGKATKPSVPMMVAILMALSLPSTMPTTLPPPSRSGPPLLPGWTGAEICKNRLSSPMPERAVMFPVVRLPPEASRPGNGKP